MREVCGVCGWEFKDDPYTVWAFNEADRGEPRLIRIAQCPHCKAVELEVQAGERKLDTGYAMEGVNGWYIKSKNPPPPPEEGIGEVSE